MRNYKLDNIKFLMLFLVVFGHVLELGKLEGLNEAIYTIIYVVHMPLTVMVSGHFTRLAIDKGTDSIVQRYVKLVAPSIVMQLIFAVTSYIFTGTVQLYWVLWYTVALVIWDYLVEHIRFKYWVIPLVVLIFLFGNTGMIMNAIFGRLIYFAPFFLFGYYFDLNSFTELPKKIRVTGVVVSLCALILSLSLVKGLDQGYSLFYFTKSYSELGVNFTDGMLLRLLSYIASFAFSFAFLLSMPNVKLDYVESTNTMTTFILHGLLVKMLFWVFGYDSSNLLLALLLTVVIFAITSHKEVFKTMFEPLVMWSLMHINAVKVVRSVSLFLIFAVFGFLASPLVAEAKTSMSALPTQTEVVKSEETPDFLVDTTENTEATTDETTISSTEVELTTEINSIESVEVTTEAPTELVTEVTTESATVTTVETTTEVPKVPVTTQPVVKEEVKGYLLGSVTSVNANRAPRVEYDKVYDMYSDAGYLSYTSTALLLDKQGYNLKVSYEFNNDSKGYAIKLTNGKYIGISKNKPIVSATKTIFKTEAKDNKVAYRVNNSYLAVSGVDLVLSPTPYYWTVKEYTISNKNMTYFSQIDKRWRNTKFANSTISMRGCSLISMAMILNYLVDDTITGQDMIDLEAKHNLGREEPPRINLDKWTAVVQKEYGVKIKKVAVSDIASELRSGRLIYLHTTRNTSIGYKNFGHLIVLYGITANGNIKFLDPYPGDIYQVKEDGTLQFGNKTFSYPLKSGATRTSFFTGFITADYISKAENGVTVYSIWR